MELRLAVSQQKVFWIFDIVAFRERGVIIVLVSKYNNVIAWISYYL